MKLAIEKSVLLSALNKVQNAIDKKGTIAILSNIKIQVSSDQITLTATDLDIQIVCAAKASVDKGGEITVPGLKLNEIVTKMPEGAEILMSLKDNGILHMQNGKTRYHIKTLPVSDFPKLQDEKSYPVEFSLPVKDMQKLLDQTKFCISQEETRYYLNGVYIHSIEEAGQKLLVTVATDGHRLAKAAVPAPKGAEKLSSNGKITGVIIPKKAVLEIIRLLGDVAHTPELPIMVSVSDTKLKLDLDGTLLSTKLIDGKFPDYARVIPVNNEKSINMSGTDLLNAVDRVSAISSDKIRSVKFILTKNNLMLSVSSQDHGDAEEEIPVNYTGDELSLSFNCRFVMELLTTAKADKLTLMAQDSFTPVLVKNPEDPSVLYVMMPLRI